MNWFKVFFLTSCLLISYSAVAQEVEDTLAPPSAEEEANEFEDEDSNFEELPDSVTSDSVSFEEEDEANTSSYESTPDVEMLAEEPLPVNKRNTPKNENFYQGKKYIRHPNAKKGLIKIDKEKIYYYKTDVSPQDKASSIRFGFFEPINLANKEGLGYDTIYTEPSSLMLLFDYEWQLWQGSIGKLGAKVGLGFYTASGTGRFENSNEIPREEFTFFILPLSFSAIYRMQFWDKQWLVPYLDGGGDVFAFAESRDDHKNPDLGAKFGGALAAHAAAGVALSLDSIMTTYSKVELDKEYGINSLWLTAEFRAYAGFGSYDFTSSQFNGGFMAEF